MKLSDKELDMLERLKQAGCAVVVFIPEELGVATPEDVEEYMIRRGWDVIYNLNQKTNHVPQAVATLRLLLENDE
jgi:hypothetical protein